MDPQTEVAEPQKRTFGEIFDKESEDKGESSDNSSDKIAPENKNNSKPKLKRARLDGDSKIAAFDFSQTDSCLFVL